MKQALPCIFAVYFLLGFSMIASAAEEVKRTADKSVAATIAADAKEVKKESVKIYQESKETIARDIKQMKEEIPKDLQEAKDSAIQQSKEVKESVKQELKEIQDNLTKSSPKPKSESK
jgi:hypothetical protein